MFKRVFLFLLTNIAVIAVMSFVLQVLNVQPYLSDYGLEYQQLLIYATVVGFTGSIISLFMSKWMAMHAFNVQIIKRPSTDMEAWLLSEIGALAKKNQINMPEVGIYNSPEPNAFATGWNKNNALIAISSGLLNSMNREGIEGVLGHEISHAANGDMVTLALIQGVVNTFVIFFARVAASIVSTILRKDSRSNGGGYVYYGIVFLFEMLFGVLASVIVMWFSRYREYRADAGSARHVGKLKMISALKQLQALTQKTPTDNRAPTFNTMKISHQSDWFALFASHPRLEKRIEALEKGTFY
ncbi:MAG: protease HtpX [Candidatus Berkiella sp.]